MWGAPEEIATDGGATYMAASTQRFLADWVVRHRVSSAYNPHSNLRAESAVKTVKRLIARNTGSRGDLNTDALAMALLQHRNTPDRDTGRLPAQVLFSRKLRDAVPVKPEDLRIRPEWVLTSEAREKALARRHAVRGKELEEHTRPLSELEVGAVVQVQNQAGPHKNKWDVSGTVVEVLGYDSYNVRLDGSGRVTKRNRRFLRPILPYTTVLAKGLDHGAAKDNDSTVLQGRVPPSTSTGNESSGMPLGVPASPGGTTGARVPGDVPDAGDGLGGPSQSVVRPGGRNIPTKVVANVRPGATFVGKSQANDVTHAQGQTQAP